VFGTSQGESVLEELKKMTGQNTSSVMLRADGTIDQYHVFVREGRRSIWLDIQNVLKEPPEIPEETDEGEN